MKYLVVTAFVGAMVVGWAGEVFAQQGKTCTTQCYGSASSGGRTCTKSCY